MQDHQHHLRALLGSGGQLAYYGVQLPQPQESGGREPERGRGRSSSGSAAPEEDSDFSPLLEDQGDDALSPSLPATSTAPPPTTTTTQPTSCTSSAPSCLSTALKTPTSEPHLSEVTSTTLGSDNSSCSAVSGVARVAGEGGEGQEVGAGEKEGRRSPPGPSRMVTRSQTAAVRPQPSPAVSPDLPPLRPRASRRSRGDREGRSSPRDPASDLDGASGTDLDELPMGKNPPGSGIELGSVCRRCGAVLMTGGCWTAHQAAHGQQGAHCRYCPQVFLTTHGRDAHQHLHGDTHTQDVDDYCECAICGGAFINVLYLELHLLQLHGRAALNDPQAVRLGSSSSGEGGAGGPREGEGEGGWAVYRCGVCGQQFTYSFNLDCHMVLHTRPSYCCSLCEASFPSLDPLLTHARAHRLSALPCPIVPVRSPAPGPTAAPVPPPASSFYPAASSAPFSPLGPASASSHLSFRRPARTRPYSPRTASPGAPSASGNTWSGLGRGMVSSQAQTGAAPPTGGVPLNSAMLNYYMMSLWGEGERPSLGPAQACRRAYISPYLLYGAGRGDDSSPERQGEEGGVPGGDGP